MFNLESRLRRTGQNKLDDSGMQRTAVTIPQQDDNPISCDSAIRGPGRGKLNKKTLDCAAAAGSPNAQSVPYQLGDRYCSSGNGPTTRRVEVGRRKHAGGRRNMPNSVGRRLGVEALNRFECYSSTTHADSTVFVREDRPIRPCG